MYKKVVFTDFLVPRYGVWPEQSGRSQPKNGIVLPFPCGAAGDACFGNAILKLRASLFLRPLA